MATGFLRGENGNSLYRYTSRCYRSAVRSVFNSQDPKRGTAVVRGNNIYYEPNENQNGIDELIYKVDTGFSIDTATVVIKITEINDPPIKVELLDNSVPENILANTKVGELSTIDPDGNDDRY